MDDESSMERWPSHQFFFFDSGKTVVALPGFSLSVSDFELLLCIILCLRSCLNLSEINFPTGRSDGRQASRRKATLMLADSCLPLPTKNDQRRAEAV